MQSLLKEQTAEKHRIAERKPFNMRMFKGELNPQAYLHYLEQQLAIFTALEQNPLPHSSLNRTQPILEDIHELEATGAIRKGELAATTTYKNYLSNLTATEQLPHIYLHYLAIAYGGQIMKTKVPSKGAFYEFSNFEACILSIRKIQQDSWVNEVNKGYDAIIDIFDALEATLLETTKIIENA
jgi:heme oxygenase